jgi:hypothetical protein
MNMNVERQDLNFLYDHTTTTTTITATTITKHFSPKQVGVG